MDTEKLQQINNFLIAGLKMDLPIESILDSCEFQFGLKPEDWSRSNVALALEYARVAHQSNQ